MWNRPARSRRDVASDLAGGRSSVRASVRKPRSVAAPPVQFGPDALRGVDAPVPDHGLEAPTGLRADPRVPSFGDGVRGAAGATG